MCGFAGQGLGTRGGFCGSCWKLSHVQGSQQQPAARLPGTSMGSRDSLQPQEEPRAEALSPWEAPAGAGNWQELWREEHTWTRFVGRT